MLNPSAAAWSRRRCRVGSRLLCNHGPSGIFRASQASRAESSKNSFAFSFDAAQCSLQMAISRRFRASHATAPRGRCEYANCNSERFKSTKAFICFRMLRCSSRVGGPDSTGESIALSHIYASIVLPGPPMMLPHHAAAIEFFADAERWRASRRSVRRCGVRGGSRNYADGPHCHSRAPRRRCLPPPSPAPGLLE